jgi:hypothetical protein
VPAGKLNLPVAVTKPTGPGVVRLTLLTSQLRPLVNGQTDSNQALRAEKPVELPATAAEGELVVLVPPQLPAPVYDLTVQADLLTADNRTVVATAFAPVRRMAVKPPLVVRLDGPSRIEVEADPKKGTTAKIQGQIERREGLTGEVAVALTGLPPGARADAATVKADATAFTLTVVLPANLPAGEIPGLKLSATAAPDPKQPNVKVRSREVDLTLVIRPPAK